MSALPNHDQLLDLLARQAIHGLSETETAELKTLQLDYPDVTGDEFDASVAAILLAGGAGQEVLPAHLAAKILASAPSQSVTSNVVSLPAHKPAWRSEAAGWWSAAACLALAIIGWWPRIAGERVEPTPVAVCHCSPPNNSATPCSLVVAPFRPAGHRVMMLRVMQSGGRCGV